MQWQICSKVEDFLCELSKKVKRWHFYYKKKDFLCWLVTVINIISEIFIFPFSCFTSIFSICSSFALLLPFQHSVALLSLVEVSSLHSHCLLLSLVVLARRHSFVFSSQFLFSSLSNSFGSSAISITHKKLKFNLYLLS